MRHQKKRHKLARGASHRKATLAALGNALIQHKRITTTVPKAKALRVYIEPLITRAKEDTSHNRRQVFRRLHDNAAVSELFTEVSAQVGDRPGGYTRIVKLGQRAGDGAPMAVIELVDYNDVQPDGTRSASKRTRRGGGKGRRRGGRSSRGAAAQAAGAATAESAAAETDASHDAPDDVADDVAADATSEVDAAMEQDTSRETDISAEEQTAAADASPETQTNSGVVDQATDAAETEESPLESDEASETTPENATPPAVGDVDETNRLEVESATGSGSFPDEPDQEADAEDGAEQEDENGKPNK